MLPTPEEGGPRELLELDEMEGKVVRGYAFSHIESRLLLVFEDDTYVVIGASHGYDNEIELNKVDFDYSEHSWDHMIRLGIYTKEKLQKLRELDKENARFQSEMHDRATYERLKAKFGGT